MKNESSRTRKNLEQAFAGESMANRKYLYFAKNARRLGNIEIAELFEEIAQQETPHAFAHLELMYPPESLTVSKLLEIAIEGEFERVAREEGDAQAVDEFIEQANESKEHAAIFTKAAKQFSALAKVEKIHAGRYQDALSNLKIKAL
jgi:rubrerythrin